MAEVSVIWTDVSELSSADAKTLPMSADFRGETSSPLSCILSCVNWKVYREFRLMHGDPSKARVGSCCRRYSLSQELIMKDIGSPGVVQHSTFLKGENRNPGLLEP